MARQTVSNISVLCLLCNVTFTYRFLFLKFQKRRTNAQGNIMPYRLAMTSATPSPATISRRSTQKLRITNYSIQINYQPDATIFQFIILTFIYSSTCFGRSPAHHQELNDCSSSSLWFCLRIVVIAVLRSWSDRPAGPTTKTSRLSPRYEGKTRGCCCCSH